MSEINDGGPAFPSKASADVVAQAKGLGYHVSDNKGMSLRDYFAAKAMQGMLGVPGLWESIDDADLACNAYAVANAMIAERLK